MLNGAAMLAHTLFLAAAVAAFAPSTAKADCIASCADICHAPGPTGFYRAEVTAVSGGFPMRARLVEHLSGEAIGTVGDEIDNVYAEGAVPVGGSLFIAVAAYTDGTSGTYVYNVAHSIDAGEVVCPVEGMTVPVEQFAAMAASPSCVEISRDLDLVGTPCDDTVEDGGCNAGAGGLGVGAMGALVLGLRRRRRA